MRRLIVVCLSVLVPTIGFSAELFFEPAAGTDKLADTAIDRSQFSHQDNTLEEPLWLDGWRPTRRRPIVSDQKPADVIRQVKQSPEIGSIESPMRLEPTADHFESNGVDLNQPCPECFDEDQPWVSIKQSRVTLTWLAGGSNDIGMADFDARSSLIFPNLDGVTITPGFQTHFLDGPTRTDLPERLHNLRMEFRWKRQHSQQFWYELAITPGIYSDFQRQNSDGFRIIGQGLGFWAFSYETQAVFGLTYLDREDIKILPVVGIIHAPRDDLRLNLVFPAPKVSYRFRQRGGCDLWGYLAGEFGGGSWAVERNVGGTVGRGRRRRVVPQAVLKDVASYTDWRMIVGLERKMTDGATMFLEAGYVFNRELEYKSGIGDFDPGETAMLRVGLRY